MLQNNSDTLEEEEENRVEEREQEGINECLRLFEEERNDDEI